MGGNAYAVSGEVRNLARVVDELKWKIKQLSARVRELESLQPTPTEAKP
jgi:hypothetical protein